MKMLENDQKTLEILRKFKKLPKRYQARSVTVSFKNEDFYSIEAEELGLPLGASIRGYLKIQPANELFSVYAKDELAEKILDIPKGCEITAEAKCVFGIYKEVKFTADEPVLERGVLSGLLITKVIDMKKPDENR